MHAVTLDSSAITHTRLLVVEPANLVRSCLQALLGQLNGIEVAGCVGTLREGLLLAEALAPDLLLVNVSALLVTGFDAVRQVRECCRATRLLVLTAGDSEQSIEQALCAGADGCVNIGATLEELGTAIRLTMTAAKQQDRNISGPGAGVRHHYGYGQLKEIARVKLTPRESEVLRLIASGRTNKAIAAYLCLSISTIERHRTNLIRKLDRHNAAALTAYAIRVGLVCVDHDAPGIVYSGPSR
jgi:two-component system, NarL family, response regulator NreC